ncbi:DnaK suppressor protein [Sulfitobacter noctilucicola]|uniref:RNA polymerase-binding transcription factor DksA n=1 Tax=Sulfitobacter noctilucicola TaxID=1342301 RepID=A0A7W6M786_9RHOB|nr:TraR/DksA family transcriptional regulator [Sulfitobacter noctilucicola]KIN62691.1 DnaK suppressor protein [Sulfitobacter noctilucicola]MBB4172776.1 RNA polymerase-binding transcription factor DksA [Sulfitobacter noctilucicola]
MTDLNHYKKLITDRLTELDERMHVVDHELSEPVSPDMNDQAIDIEDDQVLEGLGNAAQQERVLLGQALARIEDGTYGECQKCGNPISDARLNAVPYAPLCKECVQAR